jgi:hypothetical protein
MADFDRRSIPEMLRRESVSYSVLLQAASCFVDAKDVEPALAAIKALHGQETTGCAGAKHFSFVRPEAFLHAQSLGDALAEWRWVAEPAPDGSIAIVDFTGQSFGDEDLLFAAIAPFVRPGSYIDMAGEDGAMWRWLFHDRAVYVLPATVTYPEPQEAQRWVSGRPWLWGRRLH